MDSQKIDIPKLLRQKDELDAAWHYLCFDAKFPEKEVRRWLLDYDPSEIEAAFVVLGEEAQEMLRRGGGELTTRNTKKERLTAEIPIHTRSTTLRIRRGFQGLGRSS